jgi:hypothetical protein
MQRLIQVTNAIFEALVLATKSEVISVTYDVAGG